MFRTLAIVAATAFVIAALSLAGAAALAGPDLAKSDFWRDFDWDGGHRIEMRVDDGGPAVTQARELTGFTHVNVGGGLDADVTVGPDFKVEVIGPRPDVVITELRGTELSIHPQRRNWWGNVPHTQVRISMPALSGATSSAGAELTIAGMTGGDLSLEASAGASLDASGTCAALDVEASSGANVDASELTCATGDAEASSGGSVDVNVTGVLNVEASSGGSIDASGAPQMGRVDISSGGSYDHD